MTRYAFAIPGDLATPAGGYVYARKILPLLAERLGVEVCPLPVASQKASEAVLNEARAMLTALDGPDAVFLINGLAYSVLPLPALEALRAPVVALVHHPHGLGGGT